MKKLFEPVAKSIKDADEDVTETMTESSKENNEALANSNDDFLELMNDRGILAS